MMRKEQFFLLVIKASVSSICNRGIVIDELEESVMMVQLIVLFHII